MNLIEKKIDISINQSIDKSIDFKKKLLLHLLLKIEKIFLNTGKK